MRNRQSPKDRLPDILSAAVRVAQREGYLNMSREDIALAAACSPALVSHYLGTMAQMRRRVMGEAIRCKCLSIIAQGVIAKDTRALGAPDELRRAAMESML